MVGLICLKELILIKPKSHAVALFENIFFLLVNFFFQPKTCDGCHDLIEKTASFDR